MVEGAALEKRWAERPRGFKSHPLRIPFLFISNLIRGRSTVSFTSGFSKVKRCRLDTKVSPWDEPEFKRYLTFLNEVGVKCRSYFYLVYSSFCDILIVQKFMFKLIPERRLHCLSGCF